MARSQQSEIDISHERPAPPSPSRRFDALDGLRGFALLLGVFYHGAESFVDGHWNWAIIDSDPSQLLEFLRHVSHSFRMELFFLLAGFFACLVLGKRGLSAFAWNRWQRIGVPLIVGWLILFPCLMYLWIQGALISENFRRIPIPEDVRDLPTWKLWLGFIWEGGMVRFFSMGHLWFLHQLLVIYVVFLGLRAVFLRLPGMARMADHGDRVVAGVLRHPLRIGFLALPTVGCLLLMNNWSVDTPMDSLIPYLPTTLLYGFCFTVGWWIHRQPALLGDLSKGWPWALVAGGLAIIVTALFPEILRGLNLTGLPRWGERLIYTGFYAVAMWGFSVGFLGLFTKTIQGERRVWRYVAESSYWVYLLHLPLVVALQLWVGPWEISWMIKYPIIILVAFPLLYLSYHYLARSTFLGRQLNGKTWPFTALPPWLGAGPKNHATR